MRGHAALRKLARLKFRAWLRSTRRRFSTPSGMIFGAIGFVLMGLWLASIFLRSSWMPEPGHGGSHLIGMTKIGILLLLGLTITSSFGHRGLYLPKEELERLLAAPVPRSDLVRYRLWTTLLRTLLFTVILSWFFSRRMPNGLFGFAGAFVTVLTTSVIGQGVSLFAGSAENRFAGLGQRVPLAVLRVATALAFAAFAMLVLYSDRLDKLFPSLVDSQSGPLAWLESRAFEWATLALEPWVRAIRAPDWATFLPWFVFILLAWVLLFEAVARLPIDFRELSLETSSDIARRLNRLRSGRGVLASARAKRGKLGWRVPWLMGRGAFGAVAWIELCSILRKARGTLMFSTFIFGLLTVASLIDREGPLGDPLWGGAFVAGMGTLYLGWGLRFDFRSKLDTMQAVKTWPLASWRVFLATLMPEVLLVSGLVTAALLLRSIALGAWHPGLVLILLVVPGVSLLWLGLDNAVFLLLPVRYVPGQSGAMHHTGRQVVMVLLRSSILGVVILIGMLIGALAWYVGGQLALAENQRMALAAAVVGPFFIGVLYAVVAFGGWALRRFDVSRLSSTVT